MWTPQARAAAARSRALHKQGKKTWLGKANEAGKRIGIHYEPRKKHEKAFYYTKRKK